MRLRLHAVVAKRLVRRYGFAPHRVVARLDSRAVFVVGSPRSGTTFTARSIGDVNGFADLGEVNSLKASISTLERLPVGEAGRRIRRILSLSQRIGMVGGLRPIEQTPEVAFVMPAAMAAYPDARFLHLVRDGRDVVCSLIERGWLRDGGPGVKARATERVQDDAGKPFGDYARPWVEPDRAHEFSQVSEARRAAWAWRRYNEAALAHAAALGSERTLQLRYEQLVTEPEVVAHSIAAFLGDVEHADQFVTALSAANASSLGRWRKDLTPEQLTDIDAEAGTLLRSLGYESAPHG